VRRDPGRVLCRRACGPGAQSVLQALRHTYVRWPQRCALNIFLTSGKGEISNLSTDPCCHHHRLRHPFCNTRQITHHQTRLRQDPRVCPGHQARWLSQGCGWLVVVDNQSQFLRILQMHYDQQTCTGAKEIRVREKHIGRWITYLYRMPANPP